MLGALAVIGLIAALQFTGGDNTSEGHKSVDLSVPILALVALLVLLLMISQIRRALR